MNDGSYDTWPTYMDYILCLELIINHKEYICTQLMLISKKKHKKDIARWHMLAIKFAGIL